MPIVRDTASLPARSSDGVTETLVADPEVFGAPVPLRLRRIEVSPGRSAAVTASGTEVMAYVLSGAGTLAVGGEQHMLGPESMAWIDPPSSFELAAGDGGLVVLVAEAPPADATS